MLNNHNRPRNKQKKPATDEKWCFSDIELTRKCAVSCTYSFRCAIFYGFVNTSQAVFGLLGQGCTEYVIFVKLFLLGTIIISLPMYATTINSAVPHFITLTTMSLITVKVACRVHVAYFKE